MPIPEEKAMALLEEIKTEGEKVHKDMAQAQDALAEQVRSQGGVTTETKQTVDKLEEQINNLTDAYDEIKELAPQLREMHSEFQRPGGPAHKGRTAPGHRFAESEQYKTFKETGEQKSRNLNLGTMNEMLGEQKMITSDEAVWGGAGLLIEPIRIPGIMQQPQRELRFRDLVNTQLVSSDAIVYVKETGFANLYAVLTASASAAQPIVTLDSVSGFFAGQTVIVGTETKIIATSGVNSATNQLTFTTNLATPKAAGVEVTSDHLAGTPHGGKKPQANIRFDSETATLITVAHWLAAHRQTLEDAPQLQNYVNTRLLFGLEMALEQMCFYGTGTNSTLLGIFNHPEVQDQGTRTGNDVWGNPLTEIDWIRKAMTKAQVGEFPVNGIMVNPLNWEGIELAKDSEGRYLWVTQTEQGVRRVFSTPVVVSTVIRAGEFLTGAFGLGLTLLDRQAANIRVSDSHAEQFIQNVLAILAELRVGLAYIRPETLIKGKF